VTRPADTEGVNRHLRGDGGHGLTRLTALRPPRILVVRSSRYRRSRRGRETDVGSSVVAGFDSVLRHSSLLEGSHGPNGLWYERVDRVGEDAYSYISV